MWMLITKIYVSRCFSFAPEINQSAWISPSSYKYGLFGTDP